MPLKRISLRRPLESPPSRGSTAMVALLILLPSAAAYAFHAKHGARGGQLVPAPVIRVGPAKHTTQTSARFSFTFVGGI